MKRTATALAVAAAVSLTAFVVLRVTSPEQNRDLGSAEALGSSEAFDRAEEAGCGAPTAPIELWDALVPLTTTTIIDVEGATALAVNGTMAYVGLLAGNVLRWDESTKSSEDFLDLSADTSVGSDQGLLNVAVTPDGRWLLVLRTTTSHDLMLTGHHLADPSTAVELLRIAQPDPRHNGGGLAFDEHGDLYIGVGDGGGQGDPAGAASDPAELLGSILRVEIDMDNGQLRPSPRNELTEGNKPSLVWAKGVRNPFRIWFDESWDLWVADVGEQCREEVTVLDTDFGSHDLGWSAYEGTLEFDASRIGERAMTGPLIEYSHDDEACAVVGGTQYAGDIVELAGSQIIADVCNAKVMAITAGELRQIPVKFEQPVDVSIGPDGQLWITDMVLGVRSVTRGRPET